MSHIRLGRLDDIPYLADIEASGDAMFAQFPGLLPPQSETAAIGILEDACNHGRLWVAEGNVGGVIGFALALVIDGHRHLEQLSVRPEHQGKGLGSRLVTTVIAWAEEQGFPSVTLSTFRDVPWNGPFYARKGFQVMPESELTAGLLELREHEAAAGLDVSVRQFMRLVL